VNTIYVKNQHTIITILVIYFIPATNLTDRSEEEPIDNRYVL